MQISCPVRKKGGVMEFNFSCALIDGEEAGKLVEEKRLEKLVNREEMPFTQLPTAREVALINRKLERFREHSSNLVVVGMGGSSKGAKAIDEAVGKVSGKLRFIDNIDPDLIVKVVEEIEWERSSFAFISKSGKTLETVTALNLVLKELRKRGLEPGERCLFVGDPGNAFERLASELGAPFFSLPRAVGGRFSVFTAAGLIPLIFAGYSIQELIEGAERIVRNPREALKLAAVKYLHYIRGRKISVIMPYSSYMSEFTEWYVQLWGESLGKEGRGQTPLKAVGTASQHAILQLFIDGPDDKVYQLIKVERYEKDPELPEKTKILEYLSGKRISQVMKAEFSGTLYSLKRAGRPVITISLKELKEGEMGELLMSYLIATVTSGKLLGINPYGQPAVELGKKVAREILSGRERWET